MTKFTISLKQWTDSKSLVSLYSIYRLLSTQSTTPSYSIASLPGLVYATVLSLGSSHIYPTDSFLSLVSSSLPLSCGAPQGSVLAPILFIMYTTPLSSLISQTSVCHEPHVDHHLYADDTQLFISFSPHAAHAAL